MIGRITFWNQPRGFGFITVTERKSPMEAPSQEQIFFHASNFKDTENPVLGAYVIFALAPGIAEGKKPQAVGIRFATSHEVGEVEITAVKS